MIADFEDALPVAFLATAGEGQTIEEPSMVAKVAFTFDTLRSEALPRRASREMIMTMAEQKWT